MALDSRLQLSTLPGVDRQAVFLGERLRRESAIEKDSEGSQRFQISEWLKRWRRRRWRRCGGDEEIEPETLM